MLITGPNGSGKEKLAEIVQANSRRKDKPFVKVNAGALPDDLLEAELFGAEAGAFTGANKSRIGRFEAAHGGTLFLDEIGNLSLAGQAKLLRVLQTGEFERLGSSATAQGRRPHRQRHQHRSASARSPPASSARISTSASTSSSCRCRRWASAPTTCCCWPSISWRRCPGSTARRPPRCPTRRA